MGMEDPRLDRHLRWDNLHTLESEAMLQSTDTAEEYDQQSEI